MKKTSLIALSLCMLLQLSASAGETKTVTTTTFSDIPSTIKTDKYGNGYYEREATITTKNFKVDNFWGKLTQDAENQSVYTNISRKGVFKITTETTSACSFNKELDNDGCSGQKPFLLNNEVLTNPMSGTTDEYEVAFVEAPNYSNGDANTFYPLDVLRDEKYYKDPKISNPSATSRGFFGFFTSGFDFIFSKTIGFGSSFFGNPNIADSKYAPRSGAAEDRRQRYIANIIAGLERDQRLTMAVDGATATPINAPTLNTPVSLLHYGEAKKATSSEQCKFMFLSLSSDGMMCRMMSGFGMNAWMPFFNKTSTTKVKSSFILTDTENSLLSMTGKIENVPYMQNVGGNDDNKLSFLQNMLKPMTTMFGMMKSMMFGSSKASIVSDPVERVYAFSDSEAMTMTFAVTNSGAQVDDFAIFKLLKIRSVYGDEINSCRVRKKPGFMSWSSWTRTFYEDVPDSKAGKTNTEWIRWCQEATGKKGMFDYLLNWSSGGFFNPMNWMKGFFSAFMNMFFGSYEIKEFSNSVGRGLILNLKKIAPDPMSPLNTRTIEVVKISNN